MGDAVVIGMDTKTRSFHWVRETPLAGVVEFGYMERPAREGVEQARAALYWEADALFSELREQLGDGADIHVFCEEPLSLKNGATSRLLALVAGAIWAGFVSSQIDATWYWTDAATWKKAVLGRGAPPTKGQKHKEWIAETVPTLPEFRAAFPLPQHGIEFQQHPDLYDAFCLMRYGVDAVRNIGRESR